MSQTNRKGRGGPSGHSNNRGYAKKNKSSREPRYSSSQQSKTRSRPQTHLAERKGYLKPKRLDPPAELMEGHAPAIIAERADWVIVQKPAGWLTHPDGREGLDRRPDLFSWVQMRCQRSLGVHQRLDVSTSGVIAFSLTTRGAKAIEKALRGPGAKRYLAVLEGVIPVESGEMNTSVPNAREKEALTHFRVLQRGRTWTLIEATPMTGRTHQIRAHCAQYGYPLRGDGRYGDALDLRSPRSLLHAYQLTIEGETFHAPLPPDMSRYQSFDQGKTFEAQRTEAALQMRAPLKNGVETSCYRLFNGDPEGFPGWRLDRYGDWFWLIHDQGAPLGPDPFDEALGVYRLEALIDRSSGQQSSPQLLSGQTAPKPLEVIEAGVRYAVELGDQLSTGLFLDQRPQRSWLAQGKKPWGRVLNTFAHAGGFSVAAAVAGAETVSIDLSSKWLNRIPRQLELNGINPRDHLLLTGDVFDWIRRLAKRGERFDLIILDPPSTSVGKKKKRWSAARDYPELVALTLPLLSPGGRLLTCTNSRKLSPYKFARSLEDVMPRSRGFQLERVCAPGIDFPTDDPLPVKNLIWRAPN